MQLEREKEAREADRQGREREREREREEGNQAGVAFRHCLPGWINLKPSA